MIFEPKQDYVLIQRGKPNDIVKTKSGLYIPAGDSTKPSELLNGIILAIGPGAHTQNGVRIPIELSVGDTVIYSKYVEGDVPGHPGLVLARETNILAVIKPDADSAPKTQEQV